MERSGASLRLGTPLDGVRSGLLVLGLILGGCDDSAFPPPPPVVLGMSPLTGPYGTEVTIEGEHFGEASSSRRLSFAGVRDLAFVEWTDTRIRFRVPFPGAGRVSLLAPGGPIDAGTFTPDPIPWTVSRNLGSLPRAAAMMPNGNLGVVILTGASDPDAAVVITTPEGTTTSHDLGERIESLALVSAFATATNRFEAFFVGEGRSFHHLRWPASGTPALDSIEVASVAALAGGSDDSGAYLWTIAYGDASMHGPLRRMRAPIGGGTTFTHDLQIAAPFEVQSPTMATRGAIAADGRLFVTWGRFSGSAIDQEASPHLSVLDPSDGSWTHEAIAADVDDYVVATETRIAPDGSRVLSGYCWSDRDFDPWDPTDPRFEADCVEDLDVGEFAIVGTPAADPNLVLLEADGLTTVVGDETSGFVIASPHGDVPLDLYPARPRWLLRDAEGGLVVLVEASGTYAIRPSP